MSERARGRVVLVTSNGWGLGHLSRELAIALAIGERAEVIMFSFSRGLPLAAQFGFRGEFCPGPDSPWVPYARWNRYVERRFELFLDETRPDVVMFDGVAPYIGVINALRRRPAISAGCRTAVLSASLGMSLHHSAPVAGRSISNDRLPICLMAMVHGRRRLRQQGKLQCTKAS